MRSRKTHVIIVNGLSASGKTTLGTELAQRLKLPFFSKDAFKELLFDGLDWQDRQWSKKIGRVSYDLLYSVVKATVKAGISCVFESNFKSQFDSPKWQKLQDEYAFEAIQIMCVADGDVLFERFRQRALSGARHPGHDDANNLEEFKQALTSERCEPIDLKGELIEVNTNDFTNVDIEALAQRVQSLIRQL